MAGTVILALLANSRIGTIVTLAVLVEVTTAIVITGTTIYALTRSTTAKEASRTGILPSITVIAATRFAVFTLAVIIAGIDITGRSACHRIVVRATNEP